MSQQPFFHRDKNGVVRFFRSEREARQYEMTQDPEWQAVQQSKVVLLDLRTLLAKLKIVSFPNSSFDSNIFISKYKTNAG